MKARIISAITMIFIAVPLLLYGGLPFKIFVTILGGLSLFELFGVREKEKKFPMILKILLLIIFCLIVFFGNVNTESIHMDYKFLILLFDVLFLPVVFINDNSKYNISDALFLIGSVVFLGTVFNLITIIREKDLLYFIYLLLITIFTDTFALLCGKFMGKHKLCEKISPNKTIEGAVGGSILGTIIAIIFYVLVINYNANILILIVTTLLLSIIGQIGDLFFSSIKRTYNVKDYSNLIPGHGGILDRFDSFIFVVMLYTLFINIL